VRLFFSALGAELPKGSLLYFVLPQLAPQSDAPRLTEEELFLVGLVSQFLQLDLFIWFFTSFAFCMCNTCAFIQRTEGFLFGKLDNSLNRKPYYRYE